MAAAADAPSIALFISSSFLDPLMAAVSHFVLKDHWRLAGRTLGERGPPRTWACSVGQPRVWRTTDSCAQPSVVSSGAALQCWQANTSIGGQCAKRKGPPPN